MGISLGIAYRIGAVQRMDWEKVKLAVGKASQAVEIERSNDGLN